MGEVYRARDTRLGREVAIKLLPEELVGDPTWLRRFEAEARALAAVNHANVATLHGLEDVDGERFLVLELVSGEPLSTRLGRSPLPLRQVLDIGRQICDALEAAHGRGVVHRDLKPANVMLTDRGVVKVLDFGLAKTRKSPTAGDLSAAPTHNLTIPGVVLGTPAYMSPEQARGEKVDPRADLWSLGCILFEMLTGRRLFAGATPTEILAAVLTLEIGEGTFPDGLPPALRRLLRRLLTRDSESRMHCAGDARLELELAADEIENASEPVSSSPRRRMLESRGAVLATVGVLALAAAVGLTWKTTGEGRMRAGAEVVRFELPLPEGHELTDASSIALAPDDSAVAFALRDEASESRLWLRTLAEDEARALEGTRGARSPFFSPDGKWLGYFVAGGGLQRVSIEGGPPLRLAEHASQELRSAAWGEGGSIVFSRGVGSGLSRVTTSQSEPDELTVLDIAEGEAMHSRPQWVTDGELLYSSWSAKGWRTFVQDLATGGRHQILAGEMSARYVAPGLLVFLDGSDLVAASYDPTLHRVLGPKTPLVAGVASFSVSERGSLLYAPTRSPGQRLQWVTDDRSRPLSVPAGAFFHPRLSPDGERLAVAEWADGRVELLVVGLARGSVLRLTPEGTVNNYPVWTPNGERIVFNSLRSPAGIHWRRADGSGDAELLLERPHDSERLYLPGSMTPDGGSLLFTEAAPGGDADISVLHLGDRRVEKLLSGERREHSPRLSPDGRWLAYVSNASGRYEVHLRSYPKADRSWQVSNDGGVGPAWSPDGRELYFNHGDDIFVATFDGSSDKGPRPPELRYRSAGIVAPEPGKITARVAAYDVDAKGDLVVIERSADREPRGGLRVVLGWTSEVRRRLSQDPAPPG